MAKKGENKGTSIQKKKENLHSMSKKMRFWKRVVSLAFVAALLVATPAYKALATEEIITVNPNVEVLEGTLLEQEEQYDPTIVPFATTSISRAAIVVSYSSKGMAIEISTSLNAPGSYVGVKDIKIQRKTWLGWETVATSEGGQNTDTSASSINILYAGAQIGETYRVTCVHYGYYTMYIEHKNQSDGYLCSY